MTDAAPSTSTWVVAVYDRNSRVHPLGAGVFIDEQRVLTCNHVIRDRQAADLGVAFPHAEYPYGPLTDVQAIRTSGHPQADVAVLRVGEALPQGVEPARLRRPTSCDLVADSWWVYGFPAGDPIGDDAYGTFGAVRGYDWVLLNRPRDKTQWPDGGGHWLRMTRRVDIGFLGPAGSPSSPNAATGSAAAVPY